ncbi:MAG TPA: cobalamin-independent methionine synthase II family protein, partial [Myxococcaceae bacterium]|nr:cobalamin-independent methionine synthase II family protein [Myxococcaceae bacterium]
LVSKGPFHGAPTPTSEIRAPRIDAPRPPAAAEKRTPEAARLQPVPLQALPLLPVMGIGSWPRPAWLLRALHEHLERRLPEEEFEAAADDAVRLAIQAQLDAGVDVLSDGEQRRDSYASFVGGLLEGCQLIPIVDLLPYVDDPEKFRIELQSLDVPAERVRHPAVFGRIRRVRPLALQELTFVQSVAPNRLVKVALPGPYLLMRTMWLDCVSDRAYATREELAGDLVQVLRAEVAELLAAGAALVQLDEPVLSEVVFGKPQAQRTFMCGALGERRGPDEELGLAQELISAVTSGFPSERLAMHVCRGNWTPDENVALSGDYRPLLPLLSRAPVGTLFLELATPRAGELEVLAALPADKRIGVGVVNQKSKRVETTEEVLSRAVRAVRLFGSDRVLLTPDCGFATFADNPIASAAIAMQKLKSIAGAARLLREKKSLL